MVVNPVEDQPDVSKDLVDYENRGQPSTSASPEEPKILKAPANFPSQPPLPPLSTTFPSVETAMQRIGDSSLPFISTVASPTTPDNLAAAESSMQSFGSNSPETATIGASNVSKLGAAVSFVNQSTATVPTSNLSLLQNMFTAPAVALDPKTPHGLVRIDASSSGVLRPCTPPPTIATVTEDQMRSMSAMDMEEVSSLLREQDADLLERHQAQLPNDATPQLHSRKATLGTDGLPEIPALPPAALPPSKISFGESDVSLPTTAASMATPTSTPIKKRAIRRRSSRLRSEASAEGGGSIGSNSSHHGNRAISGGSLLSAGGESSVEDLQQQQQHVRQERRPTLSGQIYEQPLEIVETIDAEEETGGAVSSTQQQDSSSHPTEAVKVSVSSSDAASLPDQQHDSALSQNESGVKSEHLMRRTESMDRRLCEAAQFAEAVGDATVADELQILEEDRSDYDDDDDDDEELVPIFVENLPSSLLHLESNAGSVGALATDEHSLHHPHTSQAGDGQANLSFEVLEDSSVLNFNHNNSGSSATATNAAAVSNPTTTNVEIKGFAAAQYDAPRSPFPGGRGGGLMPAATILPGRLKKNRLATKRGFLDQLPTGQMSGQSDYVYKGLRANPPEIVKRGILRGNYAQLHRKAWLEVSDKYHRYGKNLRFYYRHWESLGCPFNMFFDWLDSKNEAAGQPLPEIEECSRATLDSDTVLYITDPEVTENYALTFVPDEHGRGRVVDPNDGTPIGTGPDGWIFVLRDNLFYGAQKITSVTAGHRSKQRFHHSSFFGGKAVAAAGIFITDDDGFLTRLYPHSGHYRPREPHMQRVLFFLHHEGVDLRTFDMDMQQILHVARDSDSKDKKKKKDTDSEKDKENKSNTVEEQDVPALGGEKAEDEEQVKEEGNAAVASDKKSEKSAAEKKPEKKKKVESLCLIPAVLAACFLAHKARFIGAGIFEQIHKIRKGDVRSVSEALDYIDADE